MVLVGVATSGVGDETAGALGIGVGDGGGGAAVGGGERSRYGSAILVLIDHFRARREKLGHMGKIV